MMTQTGRESAKIIPFPSRNRPASSDVRPSALAADKARTQQVPVCDYEGGWYHDAAMQDAAQGRKS